MKSLALFSTAMLFAIVFSSCSKREVTGKSNTPKTTIPAEFAGNWSTNSIGLITYWQQGSYNGSYGNTVKTTTLGEDGSAHDYGYYEGAYSTVFFYHYTCSAEYKKEADGSNTITLYPYGGDQIIGSVKKAIASNSLYPKKYFVMRNCSIVNSSGKTYLRYYHGDETGSISDTPSLLEKHQ